MFTIIFSYDVMEGNRHIMVKQREKKTLKRWFVEFSKRYYGVFIIMCYLLKLHQVCIGTPESAISAYSFSGYLLNYSDGFGSRMLVGTILQAVCGGRISKDDIFQANYTILLLDCVIISFFLGKLIEGQNSKAHKIMVALLVVLFFALPSTSIWCGYNLGRLDIYMLLSALVSIWIISCKRLSTARYFLVSIVGIITVLIHQGYLFTYFVPVFIALLWDFMKSQYSRGRLIAYVGIVMLPMVLLFLYVQLFSQIHYDTIEDIHNVCASRTDGVFFDFMLEMEYVWSNKQNLLGKGLGGFFEDWYLILLRCVSLVPPGAVLFLFWKRVFGLTRDKRKTVFVLMHLSFLVYVPLFLLTTDYGRWLTALLISAMANIFLGIYHKDDVFLKVLDEGYALCKKYYYLVVMLLAYCVYLEFYGVVI